MAPHDKRKDAGSCNPRGLGSDWDMIDYAVGEERKNTLGGHYTITANTKGAQLLRGAMWKVPRGLPTPTNGN